MERKCRACLRATTVFDWNIIAFENITFADMFWDCTKLNKSHNEKLPQLLCFTCGPALKTSYDFLRTSRESDKMLRSHLKKENANDFEVVLLGDDMKEEVESVKNADESENDQDDEVYAEQLIDEEQIVDQMSDYGDESPVKGFEIKPVPDDDDDSRTEPFAFEVIFDEIRNLDHSKVNESKYVCKFCGKIRKSLVILEKHLLECHTNDSPSVCKVCNSEFDRKEDLLKHFLSHKQNKDYVNFFDSNAKKFTCKLCKRVFRDELMIHIHVARMHRRSEKHKSKTWPLIFQSKKSLQQFVDVDFIPQSSSNIESKPLMPDATFEASIEDEISEFAEALQSRDDLEHRMTTSKGATLESTDDKNMSENDDEANLSEDDKFFDDFDKMSDSSESSIQSNKDKEFQNQLLDVETMADFRQLTNHIKQIRVEGGFLCQLCDAKMTTMRGLKAHIFREHTKLSKVNCEVCGKTFKGKSYLYKHTRKFKGKCTKVVTCKHCNKFFKNKETLDRHMQLRHRGFVSKEKVDDTTPEDDKSQDDDDDASKSANDQDDYKVFQKTEIEIEEAFADDDISIDDTETLKEDFESYSNDNTEDSTRIDSIMIIKEDPKEECNADDDDEFQSTLEDDDSLFQDLIEIMDCSDVENETKDKNESTDNNSEMIIINEKISWESDDWKKYVKDTDPNISKLEGAAPILVCKLCSKCFIKESIFKTHLKGHFAMTSKPTHACDRCPKMFRSKHQLGVHIARTHEQITEPKFLCDECPQKFMRKYGLQRHKLNIHNTKDRKYGCNICGKKFQTPSIVLNHMATHDGNREKKFHCNICDASFYSIGHKNRHMTLHNGTSAKCHICQKEFTHDSALKVHLVSHTGRKDFNCHHCDKAFQFRHQLAAHIKRINGVKLKCDICDHEASSHSKMRMHRIKEHFGKPFSCSICGKDFSKGDRAYGHVQSVHKVENRDEAKQLVIKMAIEPYRAEKKTYQEDIKYIVETQKLPLTTPVE